MQVTRPTFRGRRLVRPVLRHVPIPNSVVAETDVGPLLLHADDEIMTPPIREHGYWEPAEAAWLRAIIEPGDTVIDVGANVGYFTLLCSQAVGPEGRVIAVEPERLNLRLLRRNIMLNHAEVRVVAAAAWNERTTLALHLNPSNAGDHQTHPVDRGAAHRVQAVALDDLVAGDPVHAIKVDTQGADHRVIEGLARTLKENPRAQILVEFWTDNIADRGDDPADVLAAYRGLDRPVSMLEDAGRTRLASDAEIMSAAAAQQDHWVNLVLGPKA